MRLHRRRLVSAALLAPTAWAPTVQAAPAASGRPILLGMSAPLSGPLAPYGVGLKTGVEACLGTANANGGIAGRPVKLLALDDKADAATTVAHTRELAQRADVVALTGYFGAQAGQAVAPLLAQLHLPLIGIASGAEFLRTPAQRYLFNVRAGYQDEADAVITQLDSLGISEIAVVRQNNAFGHDGFEGVRTAMARLALKPAVLATIDGSAAGIAQASKDIVDAAPKAVVVITSDSVAAQLVRRTHEQTTNRFSFVALSETGGAALVTELGTQARGLGLSQVMPYPWGGSLAVVREYKRSMQEAGSDPLGYFSIEGYVYASVALEALHRAGRTPERERIVEALEGRALDVGGFRVRFAADDRRGSKFTEMTVVGSDGRLLR